MAAGTDRFGDVMCGGCLSRRDGGGLVKEDLPVWFWLPLSVFLVAVFCWQTRAYWLAKLGFKETK